VFPGVGLNKIAEVKKDESLCRSASKEVIFDTFRKSKSLGKFFGKIFFASGSFAIESRNINTFDRKPLQYIFILTLKTIILKNNAARCQLQNLQ
jgi:hypothetical protein